MRKAHARLEALAGNLAQQHATLAKELADSARDLAQALKDVEALGSTGQAATPPGGGAGHTSARARRHRQP